MLDRHLCIAIAKELKCVHYQSRGDILIKADEMVRVFLSIETVQQIALLVKEIERIERYDEAKARGKQ